MPTQPNAGSFQKSLIRLLVVSQVSLCDLTIERVNVGWGKKEGAYLYTAGSGGDINQNRNPPVFQTHTTAPVRAAILSILTSWRENLEAEWSDSQQRHTWCFDAFVLIATPCGIGRCNRTSWDIRAALVQMQMEGAGQYRVCGHRSELGRVCSANLVGHTTSSPGFDGIGH